MTMCKASTSAAGRRCGYRSIMAELLMKSVSRCRQSSMLMLMYIETASYVKRHANGGRIVSLSRSDTNRLTLEVV